jgi:NDMA-dependent alcohol dehydrogenase
MPMPDGSFPRPAQPGQVRARAAVLTAPGGDWEIHELAVDEPADGEVLVRMAYAGLCYSDEHLRFSAPAALPVVGGHEGAGIVVRTGPGVRADLRPGDHVALTFVAVCGRCHWCLTGRASLCQSHDLVTGRMADGTFRFRGDISSEPDGGIGAFRGLGTFAEFAVVSQDSCVRVDADIPLPAVALMSCGVLTGWGAAVRTARTRFGDTVIVVGAGGIGINAVQGARMAGAGTVIAVDPVPAKRELALTLGATHAAQTTREAAKLAAGANPAEQGASSVIIAVGNLTPQVVTDAFRACARGGAVVIAGLSHDPRELNIQLPGTLLAVAEKRILGSFFGSCNPAADVPLLLRAYQRGDLKLDELISRRYRLEQISDGYADLAAGRNLRGLIEHETAPVAQ